MAEKPRREVIIRVCTQFTSKRLEVVDIIVTNKRLVFIRKGSEAYRLIPMAGLVGGAVKHAVRKAGEKNHRGVTNIDVLLARDKKNISLPFRDIKEIILKKGWTSTIVRIKTASGRKLYYESPDFGDYHALKHTLSKILPDRLTVK